ncbi:hypothetical protein BZM27_20845 [Paraburkholderia steynii]|uniref:Acetyl-CoA dehydrogenase-like C-terminal domain-containing protein n=1 Tax=Paraburkholderia steynii TaxID=1245441 RepID=A0A4R0XJ86_9BURK|nr:hypothetical protein BZM27_20845 [Paraburkholderia steynii]
MFAASVPYLKLADVVVCGWQTARALLAAQANRASDTAFFDAKIAFAQCYAEHVLVQAGGLEASILGAKGNESVLALTKDEF